MLQQRNSITKAKRDNAIQNGNGDALLRKSCCLLVSPANDVTATEAAGSLRQVRVARPIASAARSKIGPNGSQVAGRCKQKAKGR